MIRFLRKKWSRAVVLWMIVSFIGSSLPAIAQPPPGAPVPQELTPAGAAAAEAEGLTAIAPSGGEKSGEKLMLLNFRDATLDLVLQQVAEITGRTLLKSPGINATITLKGQTRLTQEEALQAIESVLAMNNVTLVPMGKKFLKVVQPSAVRQEGMAITKEMPEKGFPETDALISQIITLKYLETADAEKVIGQFIHGYGKVLTLERANALLVTDTASNLQRIMEILEYLDQPTEARIETRIYELKYAEAGKIASRLNELIADAQAKEEKPRVAAPAPVPPSPPGVIRARAAQAAAAAEPQAEVEAALAERGIVQGKVKIVADDRTNILIVISKPSNFAFFDKIVAILDRPVEPEIVVRVVALEYAKAEDIAGILNEFIGAAKAETKTPGAAGAGVAAEGGAAAEGGEAARSQQLQQYIEQQRVTDRMRQVVGEEKARIGQLSANTRILADKRTNSLLLMGTKADIAALDDVIDKLDTMLAQVLIEAVILEVNLSKSLDYGVDWLQRSMTAYNTSTKGPGGVKVREPLFSFGGGQRLATDLPFRDGSKVTRDTDVTSDDTSTSAGQLASGLTYYTTLYDLNMDVIMHMIAGNSAARVLSTPVIMTTDNTKAKINVSQQRPVVTSTAQATSGNPTVSYEYKNIGITLEVTPRINPQRYVVMEITQTADDVGDEVKISSGDSVPVILKREMNAQIAVPSRSTIALGGLVLSRGAKSRSKIPILGDIPILGTLFRAEGKADNRTELLVLLTPYVLMTPEEARKETERLHEAVRRQQAPWVRGWSDSSLARQKEEDVVATKTAKASRRKESSVFGPEPKITVVVPSEMSDQVVDQHAVPAGSAPAPVAGPKSAPEAAPSETPPAAEPQAAAPGPAPEAAPADAGAGWQVAPPAGAMAAPPASEKAVPAELEDVNTPVPLSR